MKNKFKIHIKSNALTIVLLTIFVLILLNLQVLWGFVYPISAEEQAIGTIWNIGLPLSWVHLEVVNSCFDGCYKTISTNLDMFKLVVNIIIVFFLSFIAVSILNKFKNKK